MSLINQAKKMPNNPGVYLFVDKQGKILYVGRATSLKRRILSYFQKDLGPRIKEMMALAKKIKYHKTETILESVILEANLIKKYWPKYNIKERDNRSFIYVVIPKVPFPSPVLVREGELRKVSARAKLGPASGKVFGPYQSLSLIKNALKIIRRIFPYSACEPFSGNPCFNYQIGLCPGLCVGKISQEKYQKNINNIILLLQGKKKKLLKVLAKENPEKIRALKHIQDVALIKNEIGNWKLETGSFAKRIEGYDISHLTGKETIGAMAVFTNGKPDKSQYRLFKVKTAQAQNDLAALEEIIVRRLKHKEWHYPDLIVVDGGKPQVDCIFKVLKNNLLNIPLVGISKFANDRLIFPKNTKKPLKSLAESMKITLLKIRNESHRFALNFSRRKRKMPN